MAAKHGKASSVYYGGVDVSPYLNRGGMAIAIGTGDTTNFASSGWKNAIPGQAGGTFTFAGIYDKAQTSLKASLGSDGGVLAVCPGGGAAIGDKARMALIGSTAYQESDAVGGVAAISWGAQAQGAIAFGQVLHPLAKDTNTTTGAIKDDGASSSTGWTMVLEVTANDGGTWVVKLQDSSDGSTFADVSGGAFASVSGATALRLASSSATAALRRYVQYVATRTGGSAGNGLTFFLAYARS